MRRGLILVCLVCVFGCSSGPLKKEFDETNYPKDLYAYLGNRQIDSTELQLMAAYIFRARMLREDLKGQTYQEILDKAKEISEKEAQAREQQEVKKNTN